MSQDIDFSKMSSKNTWFKVGVNAGVPLNPTDHAFVFGLDASLQFLETKASGIGVKSGYSHYLPKNSTLKPIGEIPLAIMYRFYPKSTGFFTGLDIGYSLILNSADTKGGFMGRPHLGYHGNTWNVFAYYNIVLITEVNQNDIQSIGISFTRNIRLKGKK
jgi:hypothetical protein